MAKASEPQEIENWEDVSEPARTQVSLNVIGDEYKGLFEGETTITDPNPKPDGSINSWTAFLFTTIGEQGDLANGEKVAINPTADLTRAFEAIPPMQYVVWIRYAKDVPVKNWPQPMHSHDVKRRIATDAELALAVS